ncbi:hypothetical protein PPL_07673 [Heterostelium album PN500]|uniref:Uncharacterized protein n=1 Tax=Heterostelium pallidum (strain ATCC 26659 / Pp 5 / PN500) TaxID=670386 RepID=D3BGM1_HETP5|nr:hypothetical protein PPL_07673 [Heterostelium album PN500]EFA79255.1 hypothetical protein PPL_07673 [Heterostelium album PN500]|eukprot:XP_020431376.1 hypothetical protein PPL_07673 [Heterostelium album PN500]
MWLLPAQLSLAIRYTMTARRPYQSDTLLGRGSLYNIIAGYCYTKFCQNYDLINSHLNDTLNCSVKPTKGLDRITVEQKEF